jgi:hypothetical protein
LGGTMKHITVLLKILVCYCIASIALVTYSLWPHFEGDVLRIYMLSPLVPAAILFVPSFEGNDKFISSIVLFVGVFIALFGTFWLPRRAKRSSAVHRA